MVGQYNPVRLLGVYRNVARVILVPIGLKLLKSWK